MAIVIDETKKKSNLLPIIGWLVFVGIVAAAVYYIFFTAPDLIPVPATGTIGTIAPIATANLDPTNIIDGAAFSALTSTIPLPNPSSPVTKSRTNPFINP